MEKIHSETFNDWFKAKVREMEQANGCDSIHEDIRHLAVGPSRWARRYSGETEDDSYIQQPNDVDIVHNDTSWARADVEGVTLDPPSPKAKRSRRFGEVDPNDLSSSDEEIMYASDGSDAPSDDDDFFEQRNVANEDSEA
ncbi:OLC1v1012265C1 [Oldenlandia corymbosa var. corymbosa]|uniref:OLC1v1007797C1 n=1 Tax=Oldenlandia corymbosa var. corymbosa TaxID=529605 RepID=A0AAV1DK41_OLDCO|nr:OLC1v1007797C1 [Oldenlandia corymbosa var. corymbosa]CAI9111921.1 OLC1v1012265C1 [Oldenlandia corymbosa var. corymbosa]